jgi:hypothetical protein
MATAAHRTKSITTDSQKYKVYDLQMLFKYSNFIIFVHVLGVILTSIRKKIFFLLLSALLEVFYINSFI